MGTSNFSTFQLGLRILPIQKALTEVFSFLLISSLLILGCVQFGYAVSADNYFNILTKTFNLAFFGAFDTSEEEVFLPEWPGAPEVWFHVQYVFFAFCSFLLAVSLTNIF